MCLQIKNTEAEIAERNILCYKVCIADGLDLVTFFRSAPVEIGWTYDSEFEIFWTGSQGNVVEKGLHSFDSYQTAQAFIMEETSKRPHIKLIACCIPKGSKYYKGLFNGRTSYASSSIKYVRMINWDKKRT